MKRDALTHKPRRLLTALMFFFPGVDSGFKSSVRISGEFTLD